MKAFSTIMKILAVLAVIAGGIYVAATYGDKIVAWCKKALNKFNCCCCCDCECECEVITEDAEQDAPVQAEETDFEG